MVSRLTLLVPLLAALTAPLVFATSPAAAPPASTKDIMRAIVEPLAAVLLYSFDNTAFTAAANRTRIAADLDALARNATRLEQHAHSQDRAFEYVAISLARDARDLRRRFDAGNFDEARFTLHHITENCIACHASLPKTAEFIDAAKLFAAIDETRLAPLERAHFQVVSRRFDAALNTYETFFRSRDVDPSMVVQLGAFADYLHLSISTNSDLKRPQGVIEALMLRGSTPLHTRMQLERWLAALKDLDARDVLRAPDVAVARRILTEGRALMAYPRDRDGLIHHIVADAILTRYVRSHPDRGQDVGEAYYLLGVATALTEHSFWIVRSDFYFESAVRLAPGAAFAPKAYARLVDSMQVGYTGSGGTRLPDDIKDLLAELRTILEQAQARKS